MRTHPAKQAPETLCKASLLGVSAMLLCLAGCAFQNVNLAMGSVAQHASLSGGEGRRVVVVVPFQNQRGVARCGMMKNSYNMDTADAVCTTPPEGWIANLLANELRAAGFVVATVSGREEAPELGPHVLRLEGGLLTLFVEPIIGFWSVSLETDFEVRLTATTESGLLAERKFFVKGSKRNVIGAFASVFQESLDDATRQLVRDMVAAIIVLMNRYPELGMELHRQPLRLALSLGTTP